VLLVEDNLIIAMDAANMLDALGADNVVTATSVPDAHPPAPVLKKPYVLEGPRRTLAELGL
jgi:hypothetical protein